MEAMNPVATPASAAFRASTPATTLSVSTVAGALVTDALAANKDSHAQANDLEYDPATAVRITLNGTSAAVAGEGAAVSGSVVTISAPGTYLISGVLNDGQVVVNSTADGKVRLVLDGVTISSSNSAAINIVAADEAVIVLAPSTMNTLKSSTASSTADADAPNAALYSMADLTIGGTGSLGVTSTTEDGIASKDGLHIFGGAITVDAMDDGIRGKDYLIVEGGSLTIRSGGDALKSDNEEDAARGYVAVLGGEITVASKADGLYGFTDVIVGGGIVNVTTSGTTGANAPSAKALKAGTLVVIGGGALNLQATDDAIHSDGDIGISDGTIVLSTGDDGVHAEGSLTVSGGTLTITRSYEGLEAKTITIEGGSIDITASDDAVNAASGTVAGARPGMGATGAGNLLNITGGTLVVNSTGDGLDANGAFTMSGGTVVVSGPTASGNGALDVDGAFTVSGGTIMAAGSSGMAIAPATTSPQGWVSVTFAQAVPAGSVIQIVRGNTVIATYKVAKATQSVIFSSSGIVSGESYDVYVGGAEPGDALAGFANGGTLGGSKVQTVTAGQHTGGMRGGGFRR